MERRMHVSFAVADGAIAIGMLLGADGCNPQALVSGRSAGIGTSAALE